MARVKLVDKNGRFMVPVVVDTREQAPFTFAGLTCDAADGGGPLTIQTTRGTLKSGDYSLAGFETRVACERKSLADLYGTIGQGRDRFERELQRLSTYAYAAVVIEATWAEIAVDPPPHTRLPPKTVYRSILAWDVRYPRIKWHAFGPRRLAEISTFRLLERFLREEWSGGRERDAEGERKQAKPSVGDGGELGGTSGPDRDTPGHSAAVQAPHP